MNHKLEGTSFSSDGQSLDGFQSAEDGQSASARTGPFGKAVASSIGNDSRESSSINTDGPDEHHTSDNSNNNNHDNRPAYPVIEATCLQYHNSWPPVGSSNVLLQSSSVCSNESCEVAARIGHNSTMEASKETAPYGHQRDSPNAKGEPKGRIGRSDTFLHDSSSSLGPHFCSQPEQTGRAVAEPTSWASASEASARSSHELEADVGSEHQLLDPMNMEGQYTCLPAASNINKHSKQAAEVSPVRPVDKGDATTSQPANLERPTGYKSSAGPPVDGNPIGNQSATAQSAEPVIIRINGTQMQEGDSCCMEPKSISYSAMDIREAMMQEEAAGCSQKWPSSALDVPISNSGANLQKLSLSDNSLDQSADSRASQVSKRFTQARVRNWKRSNKLITHIRENPLDLHLECLERFGARQVGDPALHRSEEKLCSVTGAQPTATWPTSGHKYESAQNDAQNEHQQKQELQLHNYATSLSLLYKKNQALMDSSNDFRGLLYNVICFLLTLDEQLLATPSVTKMIEVIRAHLESTSKLYATSSANHASTAIDSLQKASLKSQYKPGRKGSLGSLSNTSSASSSINATGAVLSQVNRANTLQGYSNPAAYLVPGPQTSAASSCSSSNNQIAVTAYPLAPGRAYLTMDDRRQRPIYFRRISSVSYNDEQLINDLCDAQPPGLGIHSKGTGISSQSTESSRQQDSPWRFDELSSECKQHTTSQSSLDNNATLDMMNGATILFEGLLGDEFHSGKNSASRLRAAYARKRHSDGGERLRFRPQQQPSYMSTDDYLSQMQDDSNRGSLYDEDSCASQAGKELIDQRPVDVASRRAELEWTLNKLINFELKHNWLTRSKDTLRRAIRKMGVPNEVRGKVWLILIDQTIGNKYDAAKLLEEARRTIECETDLESTIDEETQSILKQINLDVNRTMPGHKLFDDGAEGGIKLRRILVAYSIHVNREIAYCQGFNFIVALLLSVFEGDEEKALRGFICIVDHIFPSKFYFDHYLTGARADQFLLTDFICDQLIKSPSQAERKIIEGVTSSITLNWFISLFHGAVPTLTRLTILDHFMLEGVKALFRFTMAILYLAFQVSPPSSCDVLATIRNTARDMYDIKLLLSIVDQIKLPKDSYFAIRRSFYMVQSSFNSDQFYMQSLASDASRQLVHSKPLGIQQAPDTKPPAMSFITGSTLVSNQTSGQSNNGGSAGAGPRVCTSSDKSKVCIQNLGKLGRSHIKVIDVNLRSNERSLMSPLRNFLVIGVSNCGKNIIVVRQSSRRAFKTFQEQDLTLQVHELTAEIFDGFYLEESSIALVITQSGGVLKIDVSKCFLDSQAGSTETLMLRDSNSIGDNERLKLRLSSVDTLTNLLWIYVECEDITSYNNNIRANKRIISDYGSKNNSDTINAENHDSGSVQYQNQDMGRCTRHRRIIIIDIVSFDIFSAFTFHRSFGDIIKMRTSLVAFCQLANPTSHQFSSRIVRIGPTGRYEHLLSFSDVVDFLISVPERNRPKKNDYNESNQKKIAKATQRYSTIKRILPRSLSLNHQGLADEDLSDNRNSRTNSNMQSNQASGTFTRCYRSLIRRHSLDNDEPENQTDQSHTVNSSGLKGIKQDRENDQMGANNLGQTLNHSKSLGRYANSVASYPIEDLEDQDQGSYIPVNMVFIFRNGKIALFEFTESYAIHTRESQLDRYDYSKVLDVSKSGQDFIITIVTIFDRMASITSPAGIIMNVHEKIDSSIISWCQEKSLIHRKRKCGSDEFDMTLVQYLSKPIPK